MIRYAYDTDLGKWVVLIDDIVVRIKDTEEEAKRSAELWPND
jgi:hypothetical protein